MVDEFKRQTAYLCTAQQLLEGKYVRKEGWDPSYLATDVGMLSRVRMAGVVISVPPVGDVMIDDGTGSVLVRTLDNKYPDLTLGACVLLIGRPRTYGDEAYVLAEIIKVLPSPAWVQWYKDNLALLQSFIPPVPEEEVVEPSTASIALEDDEEEVIAEPVIEPRPLPPSKAPSLIELIKELDPGDGAPVDEVIAKAGGDAEAKIKVLIAEGEVFELRAGKIKVLE